MTDEDHESAPGAVGPPAADCWPAASPRLVCALPLAAITLGVGGLGWLTRYVYLRVPAALATAALLLLGFHSSIGAAPRAATTAAAQAKDDPVVRHAFAVADQHVRVPDPARIGLNPRSSPGDDMRNILPSRSALVAVLAATVPQLRAQAAPSEVSSQTVLHIDGMSTPACPVLVKSAVRRLPGIRKWRPASSIAPRPSSTTRPKRTLQRFRRVIKHKVGFDSKVRSRRRGQLYMRGVYAVSGRGGLSMAP